MDRKQNNKLVAISRWKKIQEKEKEFIRKNSIQNNYLKMRLLGYLAGDGYVSIRRDKTGIHHEIRFFPDHKSLIKPFIEASQKVYNKTPIVKKLKNYYMLRIYSKVMVLDILKEGDLRSHIWELPKKFNNKKEKREWLRAFFDSEASVVKNKISMGSVNKKGMTQIKNLLEEFNIDSKIYRYIQKNEKWNDVFFLNILKKESRRNYLNEIGFNHSLKTEKLKRCFTN